MGFGWYVVFILEEVEVNWTRAKSEHGMLDVVMFWLSWIVGFEGVEL